MPYKPKFCCQCATPIERTNWTFLTSRRFCELCETDYKLEDWIRKAMVAVAIFFGIFGIGTLLWKPEKPLNLVSSNATIVNKSPVNTQASVNANVQSFAKIQEANLTALQSPAKLLNAPPKPDLKAQRAVNQTSAVQETMYFCGAETKKGMPCSRRMKGNIRCWQHEGKPAMLPMEKLVASR
jgi:hypothetical protein